jgi:glycosyltransferase involved in cell wall biosynthesis
VLQKFPGARFVVVGEGPDRQQLQDLAQELGISAQVTFSGYCQDMPGAYASLDLMVMPSLDEGMPMTLLEAMAAKRAVIASSVGAIPEIVKHGETGLLIQPGSADDLLQAMVTLLENSSLRQRMAESARQSVARFSAESMARGYIDFYQRIGCRSITAATSPRFSTQA